MYQSNLFFQAEGILNSVFSWAVYKEWMYLLVSDVKIQPEERKEMCPGIVISSTFVPAISPDLLSGKDKWYASWPSMIFLSHKPTCGNPEGPYSISRMGETSLREASYHVSTFLGKVCAATICGPNSNWYSLRKGSVFIRVVAWQYWVPLGLFWKERGILHPETFWPWRTYSSRKVWVAPLIM